MKRLQMCVYTVKVRMRGKCGSSLTLNSEGTSWIVVVILNIGASHMCTPVPLTLDLFQAFHYPVHVCARG